MPGGRSGKNSRTRVAFACEADLKKRLRDRLARLRGQIEAVRRLIDEEPDCELLVQQLSAARAALDRIAADIFSELARMAVSFDSPEERQTAVQVLAELLHRYR